MPEVFYVLNTSIGFALESRFTERLKVKLQRGKFMPMLKTVYILHFNLRHIFSGKAPTELNSA